MEDNANMSLTWEDSNDPSTSSVNTEKTATLTFDNGDVRAVYIDWDDGASNKKDEANYQWVQLTEPKKSITVKHTYNKAGDFNPLIQTINSDGFVSRYYSRPASNTDVVPYSSNSGIAVARISDIAPSAIMKVENTSNNSGIDNSIMEVEGPKRLYIAIAPTVSRPELTGTIKQVTLSVEGIAYANTLTTASTDDDEAQFNVSSYAKLKTFEFDINLTTAANQYGLYDFYGADNETVNIIENYPIKV